MSNNVIEFTLKGKDQASGAFKAVAIAAGVVAAAVAGIKLGKSFVEAASTSENLRIRMNSLLGSVSEGNKLFNDMSEFAGQVPFEFEEIMGAATQMSGIVKGGAEEVSQYMPMIADLAAVSGLSIEETTGQVVRMFSAGAGAADLFRERGITSMLGFEAGVAVSAEKTKEQLIAAFEDPNSKFAGASGQLADTWDGIMSMMADKWFQFRNVIMDSGLFNALKKLAKFILIEMGEALDFVKANIDSWAVTTMTFVNLFMQALSSIDKGIRAVFTKEGFIAFAEGAKEMLGMLISMFSEALPLIFQMFIETFRTIWEIVFELGEVAVQKIMDLVTRRDLAGTFADVIFDKLPEKLADNVGRFNMFFADIGTIMSESGSEIGGFLGDVLELNLEAAKLQAETTMETLQEVKDATEEIQLETFEQTQSFFEMVGEEFENLLSEQKGFVQQFAKETAKIMKKVIDDISKGIAKTITDGGKLLDVFKNIAKQLVESLIAALIKMGIQRVITSMISKKAAVSEATTEGGKAVGLAGANAVASTAAAPYPLNLTAPAVGAMTMAAASSLLASGMSAGAGIGGSLTVAHGGLGFAPDETTAVLQRGERVVSRQQNRDLTDFLDSEGGGAGAGGGVSIGEVNINLPPGTTSDDLRDMTPGDWAQIVEDGIAPAFNELSRQGIKTLDTERLGDT